MKLAGLWVLAVLVLAPTVQALDFTEDFEGFNLGGFEPETKPDQDWYDYTEGADIGLVSADAPINGAQSFQIRSTGGATSSQKATFTLAGPTQLSEFSFSIHGATVTDNGVGSRQVVAIQSTSPVRTMVEFYIFCTDADEPGGCELRVRFDNIDTTGQVLINTTSADQEFDIEIFPDWTTGTYQLFVDTVDDGTFPFLELPNEIGRVQIRQHISAFPLNLTFDDWFVDGAVNVTATESGDIADGLKSFANGIMFTSTGSLFLLGLVFLAIISLAVAIPTLVLGKDNTTLPALAFFNTLAVMWLISMEWWPDWVGIALIILASALISLVVRRLLMGLKDASTNAGIVAGALGYFIIAAVMLGASGYGAVEISLPTGDIQTPDDQNETQEVQSIGAAVLECVGNIVTFGLLDMDCDRKTTGSTFKKITDFASTVFNFARTAFTFLFQLLTFSLPIPVFFNAMIVLPPAAALATVGFSFITRSGS